MCFLLCFEYLQYIIYLNSNIKNNLKHFSVPKRYRKMPDLYSWRQVFILGTSLLNVISGGIMLTFPSVLLPALLLKNNTDINVTTDQASWINTCNGIGGFLGFFVLPPIMQIFGRRAVHIVIGFILIVGWIIFALADSVTSLMAARTIQGLEMGSFYIQSILISEYTNPKRRGYFMSSKKAAVAVGILLCHTLSLICTWRQIAIFAIIPAILAIVLTLFWPESPFFLAMKGRYTESEKSFIWLHGGFKMQELHLLHYSQIQNTKKRCTEKWYKCLFKKDFMKPFVAISLLTFIIEFSGKHYFPVYVVQMISKLVEDKSIAIYVSIGADLFTLVALIFSFIIMRSFKRRTILFLFGFTTVTLMLLICFVIVFKSSTATWLAPMLIVLHNFTVNTSIIPVCYTCFGEMFSLQYKGWANTVSGMVFVFSYTLMLKFTPVLMESTGVGGVYATYGIIVAVCLVLLYGILPETKDKTLQEIENDIKGIVLSNHDVILAKNMPES